MKISIVEEGKKISYSILKNRYESKDDLNTLAQVLDGTHRYVGRLDNFIKVLDKQLSHKLFELSDMVIRKEYYNGENFEYEFYCFVRITKDVKDNLFDDTNGSWLGLMGILADEVLMNNKESYEEQLKRYNYPWNRVINFFKSIKVEFLFAWYDMWIGFYYDQKNQRLYFFPVPMCGLVFEIGRWL